MLALLCCLAQPALAQTCPAAPDHEAALGALFDQVRVAENERAAEAYSQQMWALWTDAPDVTAQALLDRGMEKRAGFDFLGALEALDALVAYCPDYAEGWNQRAFVHYLRQDFPSALDDLAQARDLSPRHVGVLTGLGLTYLALGQEAQAQDALAAAVELNPWVKERALLRAPASKPGEDL
ncbi:tetratricopeptide repeat protein [Cognatishimia sp.]|uniref:tetratricopeptide repeat protein n=1 Tax=Cognatishimia sp. TaxID=2211648 RepID=UPI003516E282